MLPQRARITHKEVPIQVWVDTLVLSPLEQAEQPRVTIAQIREGPNWVSPVSILKPREFYGRWLQPTALNFSGESSSDRMERPWWPASVAIGSTEVHIAIAIAIAFAHSTTAQAKLWFCKSMLLCRTALQILLLDLNWAESR